MSANSYKVQLSADVKAAFIELSNRDLTLCKKVSLRFLLLQQNPRPRGSQPLVLDGTPSSSEYQWEQDSVWIAYVVDDDKKTVVIGLMTIRS